MILKQHNQHNLVQLKKINPKAKHRQKQRKMQQFQQAQRTIVKQYMLPQQEKDIIIYQHVEEKIQQPQH